MKVLKRTWADISLDNLEHNYRTLREHVGKGPRFLGVVKVRVLEVDEKRKRISLTMKDV